MSSKVSNHYILVKTCPKSNFGPEVNGRHQWAWLSGDQVGCTGGVLLQEEMINFIEDVNGQLLDGHKAFKIWKALRELGMDPCTKEFLYYVHYLNYVLLGQLNISN